MTKKMDKYNDRAEDPLVANLDEFKAQMAIWIHDLEFPKIYMMKLPDFGNAIELKDEFEAFKKSMITKINAL